MSKYQWGESFSVCRIQIDFKSHVKFSTLLGFCYGIVGIPITLAINSESISTDLGSLALLILVSPLSGVLLGFVMGIIGYPAYNFIMKKSRGMTFTGKFVSLKEKCEPDS